MHETTFKTYEETHAHALVYAREMGWDVGIEQNSLFKTWRFFGLPRPENRSGFELRCEVVRPSDPFTSVDMKVLGFTSVDQLPPMKRMEVAS